MHYYIDGYNMLFKISSERKQLQQLREEFIEDLNRKVSLLNLNVSIVFDAIHFEGGRSRSHVNDLTILFTGSGESADKYIIDAIQESSNRRREVVVTNDKTLALHVRHLSAKVETVDEFLQWLNAAYHNRLKRPKKEKTKLIPTIVKPVVVPPPEQVKESATDYYQRIFETEFEKIKEIQEVKKQAKKDNVQQKPRTPKVKKDPFQEVVKEVNEADEMERWRKIFEGRE